MNLSATKKMIQVSEEIQKPVHVPVVLGNECFIITQQDVRKIEDSRFISYHKLGPNGGKSTDFLKKLYMSNISFVFLTIGELIPIETLFGQEVALRDALVIAAGFQSQGQANNQQLLEMLAKCCGQNQEPTKPIKASIAQQMQWANSCNNISPPFPFTQSASTSMSDMPNNKNLKCCCNTSCCCDCSKKYLIHQGSNTTENDESTEHIEGSLSARQMLKIRKSIEDTIGI